MPKYAVLLHGKGLRLLNEDGIPESAGVYTWRVIEAGDRAEAKRAARTRLMSDESFTQELWNPENAPIEIEIEEICEAARSAEDSGLVFYFEDEETYPYGSPADHTES